MCRMLCISLTTLYAMGGGGGWGKNRKIINGGGGGGRLFGKLLSTVSKK